MKSSTRTKSSPLAAMSAFAALAAGAACEPETGRSWPKGRDAAQATMGQGGSGGARVGGSGGGGGDGGSGGAPSTGGAGGGTGGAGGTGGRGGAGVDAAVGRDAPPDRTVSPPDVVQWPDVAPPTFTQLYTWYFGARTVRTAGSEVSGCQGTAAGECHSITTAKEDQHSFSTKQKTYDVLVTQRQYVVAKDRDCALMDILETARMPKMGPAMKPLDLARVNAWIMNGAKND